MNTTQEGIEMDAEISDAAYNEARLGMLERVRAKMVKLYGEEDGHVAIVDDMIAKTKQYAASDYVGPSNQYMYRLLAKRGLAQRVRGKSMYDVIEDLYAAVSKTVARK